MKPSHVVTINVKSSYPHINVEIDQECEVTISGNGGIEHMLDTFRASLVACGFSLDYAKHLIINIEEDE
jgi:hypothetical protein